MADKLQRYECATYCDGGVIEPADDGALYAVADVDALIAAKDAEIARMRAAVDRYLTSDQTTREWNRLSMAYHETAHSPEPTGQPETATNIDKVCSTCWKRVDGIGHDACDCAATESNTEV